MAKPKPTQGEIRRALNGVSTSVEIAGAAYGLSRNESYHAARDGRLKGVLRMGGKLVCPTAPIRADLLLDDKAPNCEVT